jgi:hypothetical protein
MARGDLFLPFLDLGIGYLKEGGRLGFVCSDRWRYMAFAEGFRQARLSDVEIEFDKPIEAYDAYERKVDTYPSLLVMRRCPRNASSDVPRHQGITLTEAGYRVRVGPALGVTPAFVLEPGDEPVEEELLAPWVDSSEVLEGEIRYQGRRVIVLHDDQGNLRDLDDFPCAKTRLNEFRSRLETRSIVQKGAVWYRPIDRVVAANWQRPKLLIPELAKTPRVSLDLSGAVPSHGLYAIFAPDDDLSTLYDQLRCGGLRRQIESLAPRINGGYFRCYKRFLNGLVVN